MKIIKLFAKHFARAIFDELDKRTQKIQPNNINIQTSHLSSISAIELAKKVGLSTDKLTYYLKLLDIKPSFIGRKKFIDPNGVVPVKEMAKYLNDGQRPQDAAKSAKDSM